MAYRDILALDSVQMATSCGNRVALIGPNGAGKSTLLKAIAGLVPKSAGEIRWRGTSVKKWSREFAYLPQREEIDWSFPITVRGLVEMGRYPQTGWWRKFSEEDDAAVDVAVESLNLGDLQHRQIRELSGGQQQRAFLARALAQEAHVLLLDEPFTGLDRNAALLLGELLAKLAGEGRLVIASHHDMATVPALFDEVLVLNTKQVVFGPSISSRPLSFPKPSQCPPDPMFQELLSSPFYQRTLVAAAFIGFTNGFFSGFVVLRKNALSVSALSHTMLPGIALGILITGFLSQWNAFFGAMFAALLVGLGSVAVSRGKRVAEGTSLAVLYTAAFAAGVAILPKLETRTELEHWLFGDILAVGNADLWIVFSIGSVILLVSNLLMRPLLLTLFEPNVAAAQGVPTRLMQYLIFGMLVLALVASLQAVGCVLSVGLLVTPAATVSLLTDKTSALFWGGGLIGGLGSLVAVILSSPLGISPGPAIVILLGLLFILAYLFSPKYGLLVPKTITKKHS